MGVTTTFTNKPINPRGNDASPLGYNRAALYSGKALDFDGVNDEISIGSANFLGFGTGSFSFAWYINSTESADFQCVIDYRHTSGIGVLIDHRLGGIGGALQTAEGNFAFDVTSATSSVSGDVFDGKWHHVVFVADRSTSNTRVTFYIDGQLHYYDVNTNAQTSTIEDGQQMYFGGQGGTQYVDASLSSLKAFNVALTPAQVSDLYNNPEKIVPTGVADSALKLWLPMMEGAGTTAYDGSGNGNHGTISGATYVHGVGAPVAQSAVIDWNKSHNYIDKSEEFETASWSENRLVTITDDSFIAPDGSATATEIVENTANDSHFIAQTLSVTAGDYFISAYVKKRDYDWVQIATGGDTSRYANFNISTGATGNSSDIGNLIIEDKGNGWYRIGGKITTSATSFNYFIVLIQSDVSSRFQTYTGTDKGQYIWGAQATKSSTLQPYLRNIGTSAITSDVLLPAGLTTGRDITGVNLFENVRKQGALNLDGNSWAEVHDNASLDLNDTISLECWFDNTNAYDSIRYLFDKSNGATNGFEFRLTSQTGVQLVFRNLSTISKVATIPTSGWVHVVGVYDGSNIIVYVNGAFGASVASSGSIGVNDDVLTIGGDNTFAPYSLNKPIAQPRIYNRALTAEEVERNYNAGKNIYK